MYKKVKIGGYEIYARLNDYAVFMAESNEIRLSALQQLVGNRLYIYLYILYVLICVYIYIYIYIYMYIYHL